MAPEGLRCATVDARARMIVAITGRRIDEQNASSPRFPLANVDVVRSRVRTLLRESLATVLVSSAACGADLIGLSEAGALDLRRRVILPFGRERFRESSVVDRAGDWGPLYDGILDDVEARGDLVVLDNEPGDAAYSAANDEILNEAATMAPKTGDGVMAVLIWDGAARGDDDLTADFRDKARSRGFSITSIQTI